MKNIVSKIWFPALVVGLAAVQMTGIGSPEKEKLDNTYIDVAGVHAVVLDTLKTYSAQDNDTSLLFGDEKPSIMARDTMKVPDSLKFTNPFLYKYYVAVKDSLTHRIVLDSLKAAGDTVDWPMMDSLYRIDSAVTAKIKFDKWYSSLDKKARKKYQLQQQLPIKMHQMDSILQRKDSIKARRDSIKEATPRILETFAIPKQEEYQRIVKWKHDRYFNQVNIEPLDTDYNFHFNDYPYLQKDVGATFLGVAGSALQTYDFSQRHSDDGVSFYEAMEPWTYSASSLPMFNTKTPYTELQYYGTLFANKEKESDNIRVFTTQNIYPAWNVTLDYEKYGGGGMLDNELTSNKTFVAATNYLGKKYLLHAGYISNKVVRAENGGIQDSFWIRDTTVDAKEISVNLSDADNLIKRKTVFVDQSYRIPFTFLTELFSKKDTTAQDADSTTHPSADKKTEASPDTVDYNITTAFFGLSTEYSTFAKLYTDNIAASDTAGRNFFNKAFYINPTASSDSMRVSRFENRLYLRLQPWAADGVVSKIEGGIGNRIQTFYKRDSLSYLQKQSNVRWNSVYVYAGAEGQLSKYIQWNAFGSYVFLGDEINDFNIQGNASFSIYPFRRAKTSPVSMSLHFETSLDEPDYYQQHIYSNHYKWDNDFDKISSTRAKASLSIPRWKFAVSAGYSLLDNNIYYDAQGIVRQNTTPMSVLSASLMKDFTLWKFHFDNRVLFQMTSNADVVPLPEAALNLKYYLQLNVVKNVLQMQIGANATFTTKWYAPGYNPVSGTFFNQHKEQYGECPYIDAFVNMQWKRACIFVKMENAGLGWPLDHADYFSAQGYIRPQRTVKFGFYWPFYASTTKNAAVKAGSSLGGGSSKGGSSALGALKGAVSR